MMKQILSAVSVSFAVIALQGCHPEAVVQTVAITAGIVTSPRPDRLLNYEIEITTGDDILLFKGSTPCDHQANVLGPGKVHTYRTNNKYAYLKKGGQEWILEGIDCNAGIEGREYGQYRLFKVMNDREAQLYFVTRDGRFRVTRANFDSHVTIGTSRIATLEKYNAGPYAYRKIIFNELPPTLGSLLRNVEKPTVVRAMSLLCWEPGGNEPTLDVTAYRKIIFEENLRQRIDRVEEGYLRRSSDGSGWELQASDDLFVPLDVSTLVRVGIEEDTHKRLHANCLRVFVSGVHHPFVVDYGAMFMGGAYIYIPTERALIKISTIVYPEQLLRGTGEGTVWVPCSRPASLPKMTTGIVFNNTPTNGSMLRVNPDGTASCGTVPRLNL